MYRLFHELKINLCAGLRLALFQHCELQNFRCNYDQLALLLALDLVLQIASDYVLNLPQPTFYSYALPVYAFSLLCFFLAAYLTGKLARNEAAVLQVGVMVYSFGPPTTLLQMLISYTEQQVSITIAEHFSWLYLAFSVYVMMLLCRTLYLASGRLKIITAAAFALMMLVLVIPQRYFSEYDQFWSAESDYENEDGAGTQDPYAAYRDLDAESLLYNQPDMLAQAFDKLKPQRNDISDLFFIGFAGDAHQDVFSKEVAYAKRLFDERFDTRGHSITLVNHLKTAETLPLATSTNLALTLQHIGELMDREEDVLLLYLTSHGSKTHELAVDFWPMALNTITPETLNTMLDDAGIKWRVVIVSACYSGGFIDALHGPNTVVATAAAADRTSFGCGNEFDFTYFGEAIFKDQLQQQYSLLIALQQAKVAIAEREKREKLEPSLPQLSVGEKIAPKLQRLSAEIHNRQCSRDSRRNECRSAF